MFTIDIENMRVTSIKIGTQLTPELTPKCPLFTLAPTRESTSERSKHEGESLPALPV
jgi:hypothetical protein